MNKLRHMRTRYRDIVGEYGQVAVVFHLTVFFVVGIGGGFAFALGFASNAPAAAGTLGAAGAGYALTQLTSPLRYMLTFAITPFLAKALQEVRSRHVL